MSQKAPYKRVLIKLSGESLVDHEGEFGVSSKAALSLAQTLQEALEQGLEIALVLGAGNLFRGRSLSKELSFCQAKADAVGMIATCINGLILEQALRSLKVPVQVFSAFEVGTFIERYQREKALKALEEKKVVIFVGGTSHPFFTTDSASSLRALEIEAEALLKATKVDGVYDKDPKTHPDAKKYDRLTYQEALEKNLGVMDSAAISLCRDKKLPIWVFNMHKKENLLKVIHKENVGTLVSQGE